LCVTVCTGLASGDAFSITTGVPAVPNVGTANLNALRSAVGATDAAGTTAVCLYDFLLIAGGKEAATGLTADRYCGGALNPTPVAGGSANSVQVCSKLQNL
jgi:hypothetical protein